MGLFRKKKEAPSVKMQAPRPKDEELYGKYLCGYSEECSLCRVRGIYSPSDSRNVYGLCSRHREIYEADMRAIKSGKAELPPGLSTESARLFPISGREIWIKQRLLEFMVDEQEITIEKAREQIAIIN